MDHDSSTNIPDVRTDPETGIMYRAWEAPRSGTVLLLVHGLGAYGGRWSYLAEFFKDHNIACYAIELRGFGETGGLKGHIDSFNVYYSDISRLREIIGEEHPGSDVILIGSSMGGLMAFIMAALKPRLFDGLVCISPAFTSTLKFSFLDYLKIFISVIIDPRRQFNVPFHAGMCTRDEKCREVLDNEGREHRLATSTMLFDIASAQVRAQLLKKKLKARILFLIAEHDELVSPDASKKVFSALKIKNKTMISYPNMYHGLAIDQGREKVFSDILRWIKRTPDKGSL